MPAWEVDDVGDGLNAAAESSASAMPARPTDHETTRRAERSPLASLSLSSIGSAPPSANTDMAISHDNWLSSKDPEAEASEKLAARRLQMDTKPWRQTGRRRKPKADTEQEGALPREAYEGGTFARMERTHKVSEREGGKECGTRAPPERKR